MFKHLFLMGFMMGALSACGQSTIRSGSSLQVDAQTSVLVLGMSPNYRIHLLRGQIADGTWVRPTLDVPEVNAFPDENGYIVVKLKPTTEAEKLGVSLVFPGGVPYGPCQGYQNPIFTLPPGTITYVGDLHYTFDGSTLHYSVSSDAKKARAYLASKYQSNGPVEVRLMEVMKVRSGLCHQKTTTIPIFIPAGRR